MAAHVWSATLQEAGDSQSTKIEPPPGVSRELISEVNDMRISTRVSTKVLTTKKECEAQEISQVPYHPVQETSGEKNVSEVWARREVELNRHKKVAVERFNTKPQLGLEYLRGLGMWDGSAQDLAKWIQRQNGLSKRRVGEFFGGTLPIAQKTFDFYLEGCGFLGPGIRLDAALRTLLKQFRLPGEAQCIDRIMEHFARAYKKANPAESTQPWPFSEDAAYILAFSLVMLNTDLHSASIKETKRMSIDAFITNNRGIDAGGTDLPEDLLRDLYDGVKREALKMDEGDLYESELITFMGARKAGWLDKYNKSLIPGKQQWHRLWFVLNDGCLYYFLSPNDVDLKPPRATIPLDQGLVVTRPLGAAPGREFILYRRRRMPTKPSHSREAQLPGEESDSPTALLLPIKAVKHLNGRPARIGTATEIRLRARDVEDASAWADALRIEEESLPAGGAAQEAAREAAASVKSRGINRRESETIKQPDHFNSILQQNSHTPLFEGWLRKRGELNTAWRRRYFALFSGVTCTAIDGVQTPADEPVLMYFKDQAKFKELVDGGNPRPYKGAVRLGAVTEMRRRHADPQQKKNAAIALVTDDRVWILSPITDAASPNADLDPWWYALEGACYAAQLNAAAQLNNATTTKRPSIISSPTGYLFNSSMVGALPSGDERASVAVVTHAAMQRQLSSPSGRYSL